MKKKLLFATIILVLLAGILYYISLPDYLVFNSMSFSNGANRDTELQVIVYQYWNTDEEIAKIEAEHNQINGHSQQHHDTAEDLKGRKPCKSSCLLLGVML